MGSLNIAILIAGLITMESLQDVYMSQGMSVEWRNKMKEGISKLSFIDCDDKTLDLFLDSLIDNSFQKLDLLKVLIWSNTGLLLINAVEDKVQERGNKIKGSILERLKSIKMPSKFSKKGATSSIVRDLVVQKNDQVKKMSDYMYQATSVGSSMLNSANTGSISKIYNQKRVDKLSPKEQASYQVVKEMLNTVQASR